ncbi:MAG TPA: DedA family protein/thiosulfate sulfurtransferase GlpE [Candidatus Dormibacteraeota bacterium]|jgi:membrane protein DedA with SNARE-associated domain/rhodanese-related sulfurtransferase|nr:DedA family protein/thiosulfate sulfurtransferase GlpE [Candidatus Dormibacteraeota bacterium]
MEFLLHHGYAVLLVWVFAEQIGLPVPSLPLLLAAGALAGAGYLNFFGCLIVAVFASVCADSIWFEMGRLKGIKVLQLLCKISLEPDSCVRKTEGLFSTQGARSLLVAKFFPGFSTVAPPLAGVFHMRLARFLVYDAGGSLIWAGSFLTLGYVFSGQIERIAERAASLGGGLLVLIVGAMGGYIGYKIIARQRFLRELRISRITAEELKEKMDEGEQVMIVDLRHHLDFDADPETIPGAFRIDAKELEEKNDHLPRDREVILYCTCPNEATSARLALLLRRQGIKHIRPLQGGLDAWREQGYPVAGVVHS